MNPFTPSEQRILVVTADKKLKACLVEILERSQYSVHSVRSASEATAVLLDLNPPRIILIDSALPTPSGIELTTEIKHRPNLVQTWVVLLSRVSSPSSVAAAAQAGVDDLLLCPTHESASGSSQDFESSLEADLRIRLAVAIRVQELSSQLETRVQAASFHLSHDQLTGLWNRESLLSLLFSETDRVQRLATPLAFLLLDLDHFAGINQEYGYDFGDKVLQEFADRLRRYLRSYDLIGRSGDDEFLIALPGCNSLQALHLAGRVRTMLLQRPFAVGCCLINLSASIGIAHSRGRSPLVVLREAERALAEAKRNGRNREREYPAARRPQETTSAELVYLRPSPEF